MENEVSARQFFVISKHRLVHHYLPKFNACVEMIEHDQLWWKESEHQNSIGGIILHIMEHIKRNTERLRNQEVRFEKGIEHYFPDAGVRKEKLTIEMNSVFQQFATVLTQSTPELVDMYNLYHLVEHTGYHLGQVVDRVQRLTGHTFEFVQNGINERNLTEQIEKDYIWYF